MARMLSVPMGTVYDWQKTGRIPPERVRELVLLARSIGVRLSADELLGIEPGRPDADPEAQECAA